MRKFVILVGLTFTGAFLWAQTNVTGTIKDSNSNPYANGTVQPFYFSNSGKQVFSPTLATDGTGSFSAVLLPNDYAFIVCAPAPMIGPRAIQSPTKGCFTSPFMTISGASQDVGASLSTAASVLAPSTGGVGGTGTPGTYAVYNTSSTLRNSANLSDSGTSVVLAESSQIMSAAAPLPSPDGGFGALAINNNAQVCVSANGGTFHPVVVPNVNGAFMGTNINFINFNDTTPVAPANGINVKWNGPGASSSNVSASIVGTGNAAQFLDGTGNFSTPFATNNGGWKLTATSCNGTTTTCTASIAGLPNPFTAQPSCTVSPYQTSVTTFNITSLTTTSITVTYAPSGTSTFMITCMGF